MELTEEQIERYSRQIILKEIGGFGQKKLLKSTVTIVGMGGLGCPAAQYLAGAGIGKIRIIDYDTVDLSNLHRQILHYTSDLHRKKVESANYKLKNLNSDIEIDAIDTQITPNNVKNLLKDSDFVIEGSDNITTKTLVNDACINLKIPFSIAGVLRFNGQILTVVPKE
ncbi:MAG: HesA/MoeB/ThiF family protein, partial [Promethearchaeota archaeon]